MKTAFDKVKEFQDKFRKPYETSPHKGNDWEFRAKIMKEEMEEYEEACKGENIVEIADALADQMYILIGTILHHGLQDRFEEIFDEVHRSNMSKLGKDGNPIYREDGKIMKGPDYFKPDINSIINIL